MELKKVIMSRGRSNNITTHNVVNDCILTVCESEASEYADNYDLPIVVHPDHCNTSAAVKNFIRDTFPDDCTVILDDDIEAVRTLGLISAVVLTPLQIDQMIYSTANTAYEMGVKAFGWNQNGNCMTYNPTEPFSLHKWVSTALGVFPNCQRWDEEIKTKSDIDFSLKELQENRIIFRDNRYFFLSDRDSKTGGNQQYKTNDRVLADKQYLNDKWGRYVRFTPSVGGRAESTSIRVARKQRLDIR